MSKFVSPFDFNQSSLTYALWLEDLRGYVRNSKSEIGMTMRQLAVETNLREITLDRFTDSASPTMNPHGRTVMEICRVFETHWQRPAAIAELPASVSARPIRRATQRLHGRPISELPTWRQNQLRRRERRIG